MQLISLSSNEARPSDTLKTRRQNKKPWEKNTTFKKHLLYEVQHAAWTFQVIFHTEEHHAMSLRFNSG